MTGTRLFLVVFWVVSSLLLGGCNSFRVSENDVNKEVSKQLAQPQNNHITVSLDSNSLNLDGLVKTAHIDFTERDGGLVIVNLTTDMTGTLRVFGKDFSLTTEVNPSFESGIRIEENRVYLVAPRITEIQVEGASINDKLFRSTLGSLQDDFEQALARYFNQHPVYVLDHSPFEKAAASLVKDIVIKEDGLELDIF